MKSKVIIHYRLVVDSDVNSLQTSSAHGMGHFGIVFVRSGLKSKFLSYRLPSPRRHGDTISIHYHARPCMSVQNHTLEKLGDRKMLLQLRQPISQKKS